MSRVIATCLSIAALTATLAFGRDAAARAGDGTLPLSAEGTLPLRLPAGGTLPLILSGAATRGSITSFTTQVTITRAAIGALGAVQAALLPCQIGGASLSKHAAEGRVSIGSAEYQVQGICFDGATNTMEIVAVGLAGSSSLSGPLTAPQPSELSGRLVLTGAQAGQYLFDVKGP